MKKFIFLIIGLFVLISVNGVLGVECSDNIEDGCTVSSSLTFNRTAIFEFNGSLTGAINIAGNNLILDGNGSTLIGNRSDDLYGIYNIRENVTIRNFKIIDYYYGIFAFDSFGGLITNNTINDSVLYGIRVRRSGNYTISNNTFKYSTQPTNTGDDIDVSRSNNTIVEYNNISDGHTVGIHFDDDTGSTIGSHNGIIRFNVINNSFQNGIETYRNSNNITIYNNTITWSQHNGINLRSKNNNVYNNIIENAFHHGLDLFSCDTNDLGSENNHFYNNSISFMRESHYIFFCNSTSNIVEDNTMFNQTGTDNIGIVFHNSSNNNTVRRNTINITILNGIDSIDSFNNTFTNNSWFNIGTNFASLTNSGLNVSDTFLRFFRFITSLFHGKIVQDTNFDLYNNTNSSDSFDLEIFNITTNWTVKDITNNIFLFTSTSSSRNQFNVTLEPNQEIQVQDFSCTVPFEDMSITEDTTFCPGTYFLNDSDENGVITITGDNVILDCNGSTIEGNWSGETSIFSKGIRNIKSNVTIKNCKINNQFFGIDNRDGTNTTILNNTINNSRANIFLRNLINVTVKDNILINATLNNIFSESQSSTGVNITGNNISISANFGFNTNIPITDLTIENNFFLEGTGGILIDDGQNNTIIKFNTFGITTTNTFPIIVEESNNTLIENNTFENINTPMRIRNDVDFVNISFNTFKNCTESSGCILVSDTTSRGGIFIDDNNFSLTTKSMSITNSSNIFIRRNIVDDISTNVDSWNVGIYINNAKNVTIDKNNLTRIGCVGILLVRTNNATVSNNNIDYNVTYNINSLVECSFEIATGIGLQEIYKTFLGDGTESSSDNRTNKIGGYNNTDINVSGNNITGFPVLLRSQGTINLTHDLIDFWFRSFQTPVFLVDKDDLYISNDFNNVSSVNNSQDINTFLRQGYLSSASSKKMQFRIFQEFSFFKNINLTETYQTNLFNLTNALIYFSNGSVVGSTNINDNDGNINITLTPNNFSYVLDNFNLTEGVTRENNPITLGGSDTQKTFSSTLSDSITVDTTINVLNCDIASISTTTQTFLPFDWTCDSSAKTLFINTIIPSSGTIWTIEYDSDTQPPGGGGSTPPDDDDDDDVDLNITIPPIITTTTNETGTNPNFITASYPTQWRQNKRIELTITIFNKDSEKYKPNNVFFQYNIPGLDLIENAYNENTKSYLATFGVRQDAQLGNNTLTIFAEDEVQINSTINFEITEHIIQEDEPNTYTPDKIGTSDWIKDNAFAIGIISLIVILLIAFLLILA